LFDSPTKSKTWLNNQHSSCMYLTYEILLDSRAAYLPSFTRMLVWQLPILFLCAAKYSWVGNVFTEREKNRWHASWCMCLLHKNGNQQFFMCIIFLYGSILYAARCLDTISNFVETHKQSLKKSWAHLNWRKVFTIRELSLTHTPNKYSRLIL
jgi:hypothetical protein